MSGHGSVATDVNPAGWDTAAELEYENLDTISLREAALLIRYDNSATFGTFVVEVRSPSGAKARDSVMVSLEPHAASNNLREIGITYRDSVLFSEQGIYKFSIAPPEGTRGIWSTGLDFRNHN